MKDSYLCSVKTMKQERRPLRIKLRDLNLEIARTNGSKFFS